MKKKYYFLNGIIILAVAISMILALGGDPLWFLDLPSLFLLLVLTIPAVIFTNGIRDFGRFHSVAFAREADDPGLIKQAIKCFETLRWSLTAAGFVGAAVGLITMLGNLHDTSHVGPSLAMTLTTVFYSFLLQLIWINPLLGELKRREP